MEAATIEVKRDHGKLTVIATGRTPRGQKYIKAKKALSVKSSKDKKFKEEMAAAVAELLGSEA